MPNNNQFYPSISDILPLDGIPESLGAVKGGLENLLNKVFYKNFIKEVSQTGDAAFYQITIPIHSL